MQNRHGRRGFQRVFINDLYHVEERLQEYDPFLYVLYNPTEHKWLIVDGFNDLGVMSIPQIGFPELDARVVDRMKQIHTANGFSAEWELKESEDRRAREQERITNDITESFAKDARRAIKNLAYGYVS